MLQLRNTGALTSAVALSSGDTVPFDTSIATNGIVTFDATNNSAVINEAGIYWLVMNVSGVAGAAGAVTLQAFSNGTALPYAKATRTFDTTEDTITLIVPVNAALSTGDPAEITWKVSEAFKMTNAFGGIQKVL